MKYFSNMREVTQYTLLVAILAILIYIAVVSTGSIATTNQIKVHYLKYKMLI